MKITSSETDIVGNWISVNGKVRGDAHCERIKWLTAHHLQKVAFSPESGAWETLFQDPTDGRYWERTYPHSEWHGGGPPRLTLLSVEQAQEKYGIGGP